MVLLRSPNCSRIVRSQACRTARARAAGQSWRQLGRRSYASGHGEGAKKASSDLPWLLGSIVVTVPSATWLWQQGPKKSDHHDEHGHEGHEEHEEHEEEVDEGGKENDGEKSGDTEENSSTTEDTEDQQSDESEEETEGKEETGKDNGGEDRDNDEKAEDTDKRRVGERIRNEPPNEVTATENKWTSGDGGLRDGPDDSLHKKSQVTKTVDPDADENPESGPSDTVDKGHEGEEKGTRVTDQDKKRKAENPITNSMHPYMADERKSKKGEGIVDTAKITGTVDTNRKLR